MSKRLFCVLFASVVALGVGFRVARPDARPMHHDEANQAIKFGTLLETGQYRYDPDDHHGPSLYYLTLPSAWARGQRTLAALDERTLRAVPALFGGALLLLFLLLERDLGRGAVTAAALLAAISPVLTYYSRFYIQESVLVFFALGFVIALGRHVQRPRVRSAVAAGVLAGLAYSTKETSVVVLLAASVACIVARASLEGDGHVARRSAQASHVLVGIAAAAAIAFTFYSAFFTNPAGAVESLRAWPAYAHRGIEGGGHTEPWIYYLRLLAWSTNGGLVWTEGVVLLLAVVGAIVAVRRRRTDFWPLYLCVYSLVTAAVFSLLAYKTPWNALPFYAGFVIMAGFGAVALAQYVRSRALLALVAVLFCVACMQLAGQDWRANFSVPADTRNPYAYAQTSTDFLRMVRRVADLGAVHPDAQRMRVAVIAGPYEQWPLPWYLRGMPQVGYWPAAHEAGALAGTPVIVASQANAAAVESVIGDRYVSEFYGLRPGVLLTLYIERPLWDRFLARRASRQP